jgi:hypothetical protein
MTPGDEQSEMLVQTAGNLIVAKIIRGLAKRYAAHAEK